MELPIPFFSFDCLRVVFFVLFCIVPFITVSFFFSLESVFCKIVSAILGVGYDLMPSYTKSSELIYSSLA